jgi:hypothetical protein
MAVEAGEEFVQVGAGEGPLKWTGGLLVVVLEGQQALLESGEGGEVIGGEDLTLDDGEIDLNLVEQLAWTGVWTSTIEGHAARRRLAAFSPRWEEPLSVIQKTRRAER